MQKTPTYLGIFCEDPKKGAKDIRGYSKDCIQKIKQKTQDVAVHKDHEMIDEVFDFPKDNHHITSLFIGGNHNKLSKKSKDNYANFVAGKKLKINIDYFVYVPGYIMVGFCSKVQEVQVDNKYPHITLMLTKQAKPVESNDVLAIVFENCPDLMKEQFDVKELKIKYKNNDTIYVVRKSHIVQGITGDNFKNGRR